jgi:tetratricopeptide (TPR) repeat protein
MVEEISADRRDRVTLRCLTWLHYKIGDLEQRTVGVVPAIKSYQQGLQVCTRLSREIGDPDADDLLRQGYRRIAGAHMRVANYDQALESARRGLEAAERQAKVKPSDAPSADIARSRLNLGNIFWITGDLHGAMTHYQQAALGFEALSRRRPDQLATQMDLVEAYRRIGDLYGNPSYFHFNDLEKAAEYLRKALPIAELLVARDPRNAQALASLSLTVRRLGAVLRDSRPAEAEAHYRRSIDITQGLKKESPRDLTYQRDLANAKLGLAIALRNAKKTRPAIAELTETLALQQEMVKMHPERAVVREDMFDTLLALGETRLEAWEGPALDSLKGAMSVALDLTKSTPRNLYAQRCYALAARALGDYYARLARRGPLADRTMNRSEALQWYKKALLVWSRWRQQNLALPYSANREKEVLRLIDAV